jgi:hypothetical protein
MDNKKKRALAERYYIEENWPDEKICEDLDIPRKTLWVWKKGRKGESPWDERKLTVLSAPHKIKELLLKEMEKVSRGEKSEVDADKLVKMSTAMQAIDKRVNVQITISVLKELDSFMAETNPEMAVKMLQFHRMFIHYKADTEQ